MDILKKLVFNLEGLGFEKTKGKRQLYIKPLCEDEGFFVEYLPQYNSLVCGLKYLPLEDEMIEFYRTNLRDLSQERCYLLFCFIKNYIELRTHGTN